MVVPGGSAETVLGLEDCGADKLVGMLVGEAVKHSRAHLASGYDSSQTQFREVLRHRRWCFIKNVGQIVHCKFFVVEGENDAHPGRVGEHPEDLNCQLDILAVRVPATNLFICIYKQIMAHAWLGRQLTSPLRHSPGVCP